MATQFDLVDVQVNLGGWNKSGQAMSLPAWIHDAFGRSFECSDGEKLEEALIIAWEAMIQARHWNNAKGISAESALAQVEIDLSEALRRIEKLNENS